MILMYFNGQFIAGSNGQDIRISQNRQIYGFYIGQREYKSKTIAYTKISLK